MTAPAGLVDASGVALACAAPPRRIVSLVPSATELLCRLGLADALVGVTAYCVEPRDVVRMTPHVGGSKDPDVGQIRALEPDLVVANMEENHREHVEALRAAGIAVWVSYPRSVEDALRFITELGAITGTEGTARAIVADIAPLYERVAAASARRVRTRVFYPIWRDPYMTIGADTYVSDVLRVCGGDNVFADAAERYPEVTLDEVAARRPEVILLPDEPFRFRRAHVAEFTRYADVPAVRAGRIHLVDGKLCSWHGPRVADALRALPALLAA